MNYLANEKQKGIIKEILSYNTKKENEEKNIKYNVDKLFSEEHTENLPIKIDEKKENFIKRIINKIKNLFSHNNWKNNQVHLIFLLNVLVLYSIIN